MSERTGSALSAGLWLLLVGVSLWMRPVLPVDETRYLSVAWEMWVRGDFLVPHLNGEPYSDKPPLLFWLIHLGWAAFGVNEWSARLTGPFFGLASLLAAGRLARRIWPAEPAVAAGAPLLLLGSALFAVYTTVVVFDMLVVFFTLLGILALVEAARGAPRHWLMFGLAVGGGVLSKGPVILLYLLPPGLLAPWWIRERPANGWLRWYGALAGALVMGAALALAWALPAAAAGGAAYEDAILWGQTAGRMVESFAHALPWWWYLPMLPLLLFPWSLWPPFYRGLRRLRPDSGVRLCAAWALPAFLLLSMISGKRVHYLLPLIPALMLPAALGLARLARAPRPREAAALAAALALLGILLLTRPLLSRWVSELAWLEGSSPAWGLPPLAAAVALALWRPASAAQAVAAFAGLVVGTLILLQAGPLQALRPAYDLGPLAREIARAQEAGAPVAHFGKYRNEYHFLGRLREPLTEIEDPKSLLAWARTHPKGYIAARLETELPELAAAAEHYRRYRGEHAGLWRARTLLERPQLLDPPVKADEAPKAASGGPSPPGRADSGDRRSGAAGGLSRPASIEAAR